MKKLSTFSLFLLLSFVNLANDSIPNTFLKHRFSLAAYGNLHNMRISNVSPRLNSASSPLAFGFNFSVGYHYFLTKNHGLSIQVGHGRFQNSFQFEMHDIQITGIPSSVNEFNRPAYEPVSHVKLSYLYRKPISERFSLTAAAGICMKSYLFFSDKNIGIDAVMAQQDEHENVIGQINYFNSDGRFNSRLQFSPLLEVGIDWKDKFNNYWGIQLEAIIPILPIYEGTTTIFPDYQEHRSSFDFQFYGGSIGLGMSYTFGLRKN